MGHKDAELSAVAGLAASNLRSGILKRVSLSALEAAFDCLRSLTARLSAPGCWWRVGIFGEWAEDSSTPAGATVELGGQDGWPSLVVIVQGEPGVTVTVGGGPYLPSVVHEVTSWEDLASTLELVLQDATSALAARRKFQERPLRVDRAGEAILRALRLATIAQEDWHLRTRDRFPFWWPDGYIHHDDHLGQHHEVLLREDQRGVMVSSGDFTETFTEPSALAAAMPAIVKAVRERPGNLTADKLVPEARYRVLRPFRGAARGDVVRFNRVEPIPRESYVWFWFVREATGSNLSLDDGDDSDLEVLRQLWKYLEPLLD